jgi:hypothetical protein
MTRPRAAALGRASGVFAACAMLAACASSPTEILLVVDSELSVPAQLDHLSIRATGADADGGFEHLYDLTRPPTLPLSLGLVSAGGQARPLHVVVRALAGDVLVVERAVTTAFVAGQTRVLHVHLLAACRGVTCPTLGETCVAGACVSDEVPATSLGRYPESDAGPGGGGGRDGGADAPGVDADAAGNPDVAGPDVAPALNGATCATGSTCASGRCVDGVCCESACAGACMSCALASAPGRCRAVPAGARDPRGACADQGVAACATNGACDGSGGCQRYAAGTTCAAESCEGASYVGPSKCAASGCVAPAALVCGASTCRAGGCGPALKLVFAGATDTPVRGYAGPEATVVQDACPSRSVLIGFNTSASDQSGATVVSRLQAVCGVPTIVNGDGTVLVSAGATLISRGDPSGPTTASVCPPNQVVVGFDGHSVALLDQLSLRCAPLSVVGQTVVVGPPTNLPAVGGDGGTPFARTDCAPGAVAVGSNIAVRPALSAFGLTCATVSVE